MRVGVDYLPATSHWPGPGRYARELVRALVALEERPDLALLEVGRAERAVDPRALGLPFGDARVRRITSPLPRRLLPLCARLGCDAARLCGGVDVFHHVRAEALPVRRARQTLALAELPQPGSAGERRLRALAARLDLVFVFCEAWRDLVADRLALPVARVLRTPVGCEHWRRELGGLPPPDDPPRILVLGATSAARRPLAILRAFERLRARGEECRLVFAGRPGSAERELAAACAASPHGRDVVRLAAPREAELPDLVARGAALVHLDPHAGTPVTPLEALAVGLPVVASRAPCFAEHLAGVAELVDDAEAVREPEALAHAIARALASRGDGRATDERTRHARGFSWAGCARATVAHWARLAPAGA